MSKNPISIDTILKHRRLTQHIDESSSIDILLSEAKAIFDTLAECNNTNAFKRNYQQLVQKVSEASIVNRSYNYPLLALEKSDYKDNEAYIDQYVEMVVPKLDTNSLSNLNDTIDQYTIDDALKDKIKQYVETYSIADRILNNHNNITERCDGIESTILHSYRLGNHVVAEQVRNYIDTYQIRPYQKMNLCLEEVFYVLEKNNIDYDRSDMVKSIVESFVLAKYDEKRDNYIKVLENNYCFTEEDVQNAVQALSDKEAITGTIQSVIDEYLRVGNIPLLDLCINIGGCSVNDIKINIGTALDFVWKCIESDLTITYEDMNEAISAMFETMTNKIALSPELLSIEDVKDICTAIKVYLEDTASKSRSELYTNANSKLDSFINLVNMASEQFIKDCAYLYNRNNIDTMYQLNTEASTVMSLQEFKRFRFQNLIRSAINLEKSIKTKVKSLFTRNAKKHKTKLSPKAVILQTKSGASVIFEQGYTAENFIGVDNKADICVAQYYYNEGCEIECGEFLGQCVKDFNTTIKDKSMQAYYILQPGIAEVHIKENVYISLTEEEQDIVDRSVDPSMDVYKESLVTIANMSDLLINTNLDSISDKVIDDQITMEQFEMIVEALQYIKLPKKDIETIAENFSESRYHTLLSEGAEDLYKNEATEIEQIVENYTEFYTIVPIDMQLEAVNILCSILEDGIKKPEIKKAEIKKANASNNYDDDEDDEEDEDEGEEKQQSPEDKSNEKKKIDDMFDPRGGKSGFGKKLNSLRLALKGLRAKMGDLGSKEQEASKNLDASADHFMKAMHDALISDRREAIIKGSVIPSFSKCIKASLVLLGSGVISTIVVGTITPVIVGAFGAFAISKKLTKRERMLMLDDLETELDVVEKEIQLAESKNQLKKYRALLKYKKDLQRQYQRIRYNHRIGKDILPNSTTGVYKPGD